MLTKNDRYDLKMAMKAAVLEHTADIMGGNVVMESFVKDEITYEQLLNVCYNPYRDEVYMESDQLEEVAVQTILECVYGDLQEVEESYEPETSSEKMELLEAVILEEGFRTEIQKFINGFKKGRGMKDIMKDGKKIGEVAQTKSFARNLGIKYQKSQDAVIDAITKAWNATGAKVGKAISKGGEKLATATKKAAGYTKEFDKPVEGGKGVKGALAKGAYKAGKFIQDKPGTTAAIAAGSLATAAALMYLFRKLRKKGVSKKQAAQAALAAAKKQYNKTKSPRDAKKVKTWEKRVAEAS